MSAPNHSSGEWPKSKIEVTIEIDTSKLTSYTDSHLALLWLVAQANPAPLGDRSAGQIVERIGREIIRRWLSGSEPELWHHQGEHYYWNKLRQLEENGVFVPRAAGEAEESGAEGA